jgi:hypothetical protein
MSVFSFSRRKPPYPKARTSLSFFGRGKLDRVLGSFLSAAGVIASCAFFAAERVSISVFGALCKLGFGILASPTFFHNSEHGGVVECQHHRAVSCMHSATFVIKMTTQQENAFCCRLSRYTTNWVKK